MLPRLPLKQKGTPPTGAFGSNVESSRNIGGLTWYVPVEGDVANAGLVVTKTRSAIANANDRYFLIEIYSQRNRRMSGQVYLTLARIISREELSINKPQAKGT